MRLVHLSVKRHIENDVAPVEKYWIGKKNQGIHTKKKKKNSYSICDHLEE